MKKSLLLWGALIVVALCFVGCCYYNTAHNNHSDCAKHCKHSPCCAEAGQECPDNQDDDGETETVTIEAVELVPLNNNAPSSGKTPAPATSAPAAPSAQTPATGN